jgi:hypothetical protein
MRIFSIAGIFVFIFVIGVNLFSSSTGITGLTKRDGGVGCICHGNHEPTPGVSVFFDGPDSASPGQTVDYKIKVAHGPAITGGFNVASWTGTIDTVSSDTTVRRQSGELTHKFPKQFANDTVSWTFKYTAPLTPQYDTLYAVGNSTNNDLQADTADQWNFSANFPVRVGIPIGIVNNSNTASSFFLEQNYPNPFNIESKIKFQIAKRGKVKLALFDVLGKEVGILLDSEQQPGVYEISFDGTGYPSGVYFYRLVTGEYSQTKRMVLAK